MAKRGNKNDATMEVSPSQLIPQRPPVPRQPGVANNDMSMWIGNVVGTDDFAPTAIKKPKRGGRGKWIVGAVTAAAVAGGGGYAYYSMTSSPATPTSASTQPAPSPASAAPAAAVPATPPDAAAPADAAAVAATADAGALAPDTVSAADPAAKKTAPKRAKTAQTATKKKVVKKKVATSPKKKR